MIEYGELVPSLGMWGWRGRFDSFSGYYFWFHGCQTLSTDFLRLVIFLNEVCKPQPCDCICILNILKTFGFFLYCKICFCFVLFWKTKNLFSKTLSFFFFLNLLIFYDIFKKKILMKYWKFSHAHFLVYPRVGSWLIFEYAQIKIYRNIFKFSFSIWKSIFTKEYQWIFHIIFLTKREYSINWLPCINYLLSTI